MIEILDHLIATPVPPDTIVLKQPNVLYEFADPALEAESAGRKLLFRMGMPPAGQTGNLNNSIPTVG